MQAAADRIEIVMTRQGRPWRTPHNCVDPVLVAAHIITAAQSIVSRNVSALDQAWSASVRCRGATPGA
jgi:metal-dependent amidase/aminoacylase/carboxypeptidase family protein